MIARLLPALVTVAVAAGLLILAWPQLFSLALEPVAAHVVSLRGLAIAAAVLVAVAFTLLALLAPPARRFLAGLAVLLLVFAAINAAVLATRGLGNIAFETASESSLRILSWNTLGEAPGAAVIARLALDTEADVSARE